MLTCWRKNDYVAPVLAGASLVALSKPRSPVAGSDRCWGDSPQTHKQVPHGDGSGRRPLVFQRYQLGPSPKLLFKLELANSFNTVHRSAILPTVRAEFPALARWTAWCYRQPTRLQLANHALESQSGVQQGDPLGAVAFSRCLAAVSLRLAPVRVGYCGTLPG